MVEGIDKLGQSLLSQQATRRQQRRDDNRANQKRDRNKKLFDAALNATNMLLQDRYNDFYETEGARLARRLTNRLGKQQLLLMVVNLITMKIILGIFLHKRIIL